MDDKIRELGIDVVDLIEKHCEFLQAYEVGHQLILNAVSLLLCQAPNHLVAFKTIIACVDIGITDYMKYHNGNYKEEEKG